MLGKAKPNYELFSWKLLTKPINAILFEAKPKFPSVGGFIWILIHLEMQLVELDYGEDADSAGEDEEDEASKEGEAQQAFVDGVVVMVMSLRQLAYLYKPVDQGNDSGDVEHARTNLRI